MRGKFDTYRSGCLPFELIFRVSKKQLGLSDLSIADQHQLEHVVVWGPIILSEEVTILLRHVSNFDKIIIFNYFFPLK